MEKLHYTDTGTGENALVFLHYFGGSGRTWQPVINRLEENYRCIAIDLPGFGQSPAPVGTPSVNDGRDAVLQVLEALQISSFSIIGHSMGGKIALAVAALQPRGLSGMVLFAPSPPTPEPMTDEDRQQLWEAFGNDKKIREHLQSIVAAPVSTQWFKDTVADNQAVAATAWYGWLQAGSKEDISAEMQQVQVPLTVVSGSEDKSLNTAFLQKTFSRYFSQATFIELPNSGHLLPLEKPDEVVAIIHKQV